MRKTVSIDFLRNATNAYLASDQSTADGRGAACDILEVVLFETKTYQGYRYNEPVSALSEVEGAGTRRYYF